MDGEANLTPANPAPTRPILSPPARLVVSGDTMVTERGRLPNCVYLAIWESALQIPPPSAHHFTVFNTKEAAECELHNRYELRNYTGRRPDCLLAAPPLEKGQGTSWIAGNPSGYAAHLALKTATRCSSKFFRQCLDRDATAADNELMQTHGIRPPCEDDDHWMLQGRSTFEEDGLTYPLKTYPATDLYILHPQNYATAIYREVYQPDITGNTLNIGVIVDFHNFQKSDSLRIARGQHNFVGFAAAAGYDTLHGYISKTKIWFIDMDLKRDPNHPLDMTNRKVWDATGRKYVQVLRGDQGWLKDPYNFDPRSPIGHELWTEPDGGNFLEGLTRQVEPAAMQYTRADGRVMEKIPPGQPPRYNPFGVIACIFDA